LEIRIKTDALKKSNKEIPVHGGTNVSTDDLEYPMRELSLSGPNLLNAPLRADRHLLPDEDVQLPMTVSKDFYTI
jgi:hypothetical protein